MQIQSFIERLEEYGPLGLFLAAFISNAIPGFPAFYLTLVGTYAVLVHDPKGQIAVILSSGIGAGLGKVLVFYTSNLVASKSKRVQRLREEYLWVLQRGKLGVFILVFLFASLPLPDDVLYIPLGVSGFSLLWFTVAVILGKITLTAIVFVLGNTYWELVTKYLGGEEANWPLVIGGLIVGTLFITYIIFAMDWKRIYEAYTREGAVEAVKALVEELVEALTLRPLRRFIARNGR